MAGREDRPKLAPKTRIARQVEDGKESWIVRAGSSGKYLRVGESERVLLQLMDGSRTMAEVRRGFMARAQEKIELRDVAKFVAQMRKREVLEQSVEGRTRLMLEKTRQRRAERDFSSRFGSLFFMRFKLFDPNRILSRITRPLGFMFTKGFVLFSALLIATAAVIIVARWDEVAGGVRNIGFVTQGAGISLFALYVTALVVVAVHEFGHGVACTHWGGEVHEMGFLLLFFQPCFYCNVNDAWTFESRSQRLWVTAAGGFIETVLGSLCVVVWALTEPGSAINGICYVVFMISISSTLLFNMNPLIKLDGYYLLADLLGIENLRDRSFAHLKWIIRSWILRLPGKRVTDDAREARILTIYSLSSLTYMTLLLATIVGMVLGSLSGQGGLPMPIVIVFAGLAVLIAKKPVAVLGEAMKEIAHDHRETLRHPRTIAGSVGVLVVLLIASMVLPWTRTSEGKVAVEPVVLREARAPVAGWVEAVHVRAGQRVAQGDPLVTIAAPEVEARFRRLDQEADHLRRRALSARAAGRSASAAATAERAAAVRERADEIGGRLAGRVVRAPMDGVVLANRPAELEGKPVARDDALLAIGDLSRMRVVADLEAREVGPVQEGQAARIRLQSMPGRTWEGTVVAVSRVPVNPQPPTPEGQREPAVPPPAPLWEVVVEVADPDENIRPGMTGLVSIEIERTTLAASVLKDLRATVKSDVLR